MPRNKTTLQTMRMETSGPDGCGGPAQRATGNHASLQAAIDSMPAGVSVVDADLNLVAFNESFLDLLELPRGRFFPGTTTFEDIIRFNAERGEYGDGNIEEMVRERVELARKFMPHTLERRRPDGTVIEIRGNPLPGGGFVTTYTDVTERATAEETLRANETRLRRQSEVLARLATSEALATGDVPDALRQVTEAAALAFAVDRAGVWLFDDDRSTLTCVDLYIAGKDRHRHDLRITAGEYPDYFAALVEGHIVDAGDAATDPRTHEFRDILIAPYNIGAMLDAPIRAGGRLTGILCMEHVGEPRRWSLEDINFATTIAHLIALTMETRDRQKAEADLRHAKEQAEFANRAKSEFLANMSHELRTPLNAIIGFSEVIKEQMFGAVGNARYLDYTTNIHESGNHLLQIINDILDLSVIESGQMKLEEEDFLLGPVIDSCIRLVGNRAEKAKVRVTVTLPPDMPALHADPRKLKQVVINLLSNAVKFTPPGGEIKLRGAIDPDGDLVLSVHDTGIGMSPDEIPTALEPFGQAASAATSQAEGTGLGLPLARSLCELHGGTLKLESEKGAGTVVTMRLPSARVVG
jgi:signal transduction histidine kinase